MKSREEKAIKPTNKEQRQKRSGSALRENLKRRKAAPRTDAKPRTGKDAE